MKVKVGIDPPEDVARVRAVREAVGPAIKLGVDANGGWPTPEIAIATINQLCDECQIYFAEQPVPAGNPATMAEVRRNVSVPIIADESVYTLDDAKILARAEAADVFSIYIGKAGGIGPARAIAEFAQSVGIKCTIGSNLELGVGSAAMIHLALSAPGIDADTYPCDIIGPLFYEDDVLAEPLPIYGGSAQVHDRPGLGVELSTRQVEKYRVRNVNASSTHARSIFNNCGPSNRDLRQALRKSIQSYFQSPGMRAKRLHVVGVPSAPRRNTPRL